MFWITSIGISLVALVSNGILLLITAKQAVRKAVSRFFIAYLASLLVWSLGALMMMMSVDMQHVTLWNRVMLTGLVSMPVCFFGFTRAFLGLGEKSLWLRLGYVSSAVLIALDALGFLASNARFTGDGLVLYEFGPAVTLFGAHYLFFLGFSAVSLLRELRRRDDPLERNRIRYAVMGMGVIVLGVFATLSPVLGAYRLDMVAHIVNALLLAYAIFRYQLLDITLVIRKGLLYSIPTAIIGASYFLMLFLAVNYLHLVTGEVFLLSLVMAAVTAIAMRPVWDRMQSWIDRLFFREKHDAGLMLQRLSRTATSVLDLDQLTDMILDEITTTMHIEKAAFLIKQEETGQFRLMASKGLDRSSDVQLREGHPIAEWLSSQGNILTRRDMDLRFGSREGQEYEDVHAIEADLFVPLLVRGELIGILVLGPKLSEIPYSLDEQLTLTTLANQTAVAIENARLFSFEQHRAKESSALLDIAEAVSSTLELPRLLTVIAQRTAEVCGVDRCSVFLLDEEGNRLIPLMSQFADGSRDGRLWQTFTEESIVTTDDDPLIKQVVRERQPVILGEGSTTLPTPKWIKAFGIESLLAVPLVSQGEVVGLMVLDRIGPGQHLTEGQVGLATTIASQVAIAIENARLYEETMKEKQRTETIVEQAFAGIMVIDPEMRVVTLNPAAAAITGFVSQEILGKRLPEICSPEIWRDGSPLHKAMATGKPVTPSEVTVVGGNGARDILLGVTPLGDGYLLSFADITRQKEVERVQSAFLSIVSHELRIPLSPIKSCLENLLTGIYGSINEKQRDRVELALACANEGARLVENLLDLTRIENRGVSLDIASESVANIVQNVVHVFNYNAAEKQIELRLELPREDQLVTQLDKGKVKQVLSNLIDNAIKFTPEGGIIEVSAWSESHCINVQVADTGVGIPNMRFDLHLNNHIIRT